MVASPPKAVQSTKGRGIVREYYDPSTVIRHFEFWSTSMQYLLSGVTTILTPGRHLLTSHQS